MSVPVKQTANIRKKLKHVLLQRIKNVYPDKSDPSRRILVLDKRREGSSAEESQQYYTANDDAVKAVLSDEGADDEVHWLQPPFRITRTYKDQSAECILRKLLPSNSQEVPTSYELVGHIAHVNLRSEYLPYKYWIGKVLRDKNPAPFEPLSTKWARLRVSIGHLPWKYWLAIMLNRIGA